MALMKRKAPDVTLLGQHAALPESPAVALLERVPIRIPIRTMSPGLPRPSSRRSAR